MQVRYNRQEDPLEEAVATHSSILTWRISWTEEPGRLHSIGSNRAGYDWSSLQRSALLPYITHSKLRWISNAVINWLRTTLLASTPNTLLNHPKPQPFRLLPIPQNPCYTSTPCLGSHCSPFLLFHVHLVISSFKAHLTSLSLWIFFSIALLLPDIITPICKSFFWLYIYVNIPYSY